MDRGEWIWYLLAETMDNLHTVLVAVAPNINAALKVCACLSRVNVRVAKCGQAPLPSPDLHPKRCLHRSHPRKLLPPPSGLPDSMLRWPLHLLVSHHSHSLLLLLCLSPPLHRR